MADSEATDASRRHLLQRAVTVAVLTRHSASLIVSAVALADPSSAVSPIGKALLVALGGWAIYRLATRSASAVITAIDYGLIVAVCLAIPALVSDAHFHISNSAPVAIVGTAVISFSVSLPARLSLPMTLGLALAYAYGAAAVIGWSHVPEIFNLYYFLLQWGTSALIRLMVLRVASAVDDARGKRETAEVSERVASAVRDYDREQLRLLHDTVATTLLLVAQGTPLPADHLAVQARRDIDMLGERPWAPSPASIDIAAALRDSAAHLSSPVQQTGMESVVVDGDIAQTVVAAAREAMNNVDRHAHATLVTISVGADRVAIRDDGVGFDPHTRASGRHGLTESIIGRMQQIGGAAHIDSRPGHGTTVELRWPTIEHTALGEVVNDPDRLIERTRIGYGLALTGYAIANLAVMAPPSFRTTDNASAQLALTAVAALCTLSALPIILNKRWFSPWPAAATLLVTAVAQSALVPTSGLGTQTQWSQAVIGWCLLPLLLRQPLPVAEAMLITSWILPGTYSLIRDPSAHLAVNIGLGTASILTVQLFALVYNGLIRDAARDAQTETTAHTELLARERIRNALQAEYRRRYASLANNIQPLLEALSRGEPVDADLRWRAQVEWQRLRALFDQAAMFDHPLLRALRTIIEAAQARNVDVSIDSSDELPPISEDQAQRLADPLRHALAVAETSARITLTTMSNELTASIVCQGLSPEATALADYAVCDRSDVTVLLSDNSVWLTVRFNASTAAR